MNKHVVGILTAIFILVGSLYTLRWRTIASETVTLNRDGCAALRALGVVLTERADAPDRCTLTSRPVVREVKLKERFADTQHRLEITRIKPSMRGSTHGGLDLASTISRSMKTEAVMLKRNMVVTYR